MDLSTYLARSPRGTGAAIARAVGVSPVMVSQWCSRVDGESPKKSVPVERCVAIEQATEGEVRRWDLRPNDWHRIWPELIGQEGAPEVPVEEARNAA